MDDIIRIADLPEQDRDFLRNVYERLLATMQETVARHGGKPGLSRVLAAARLDLLESEMSPIYGALAEIGTPVACAKGCGCCCTLTIEVTPDEVFALKSYLEQTLSPADLSALKARALANDMHAHGMAPLARHRKHLSCPVLDPATRACLGHAARPTACQGYVSTNLAQCEADHQNPPQQITRPVLSSILTDLVLGTRRQALEEAGLTVSHFELTAALVAAWRDPDAEEKWLQGEPIFPEAAFPRDDDAGQIQS